MDKRPQKSHPKFGGKVMKDMVLDVMIEKYDIEEQLESRGTEFNDELIDRIMKEIKYLFRSDKDFITNHMVKYLVDDYFEMEIEDWFNETKEDVRVV